MTTQPDKMHGAENPNIIFWHDISFISCTIPSKLNELINLL